MIFFSQAPEMKALKCIKLDGLFSLCSTWTMNWGVADSFWVLKQCAKSCLHVMSEIIKWAGYRHRIDPLRSSISGQNKSLNMTFHLKKKITEKEQILTDNYFHRSKSRNGYISDSIYFFKFCFIKRSSCFMIFLRSDSRDTRFQRLTTIPL